MTTTPIRWAGACAAGLLLMANGGCVTLQQLNALVRAPTFERAEGQPAEILLRGPSVTEPLGGATVRLWARVTNPNGFGVTVTHLAGTLLLDDVRAADVDLPLGLPLEARGDDVIPVDLWISFSDLPALADTLRRAAGNERLPYRLAGIVGVDAGRFGRPEFGPSTLLRGELTIRRRPGPR